MLSEVYKQRDDFQNRHVTYKPLIRFLVLIFWMFFANNYFWNFIFDLTFLRIKYF